MISKASTKPPIPSTEAELTSLVCRLIASCFDVDDGPTTELTSHGTARADIALVCNGHLLAIEVKRTAWRRAVVQALLNRLCFDRSYIALWATRVTDQVMHEAERWGIGVVAVYPGNLEIAVEAARCDPDPTVRARMLDTILANKQLA